MSSFPDAIRHCLRNLLTFRGRDTRSQFWFYILGLVIAQQALTIVLIIPVFASHFSAVEPATGGADVTAVFDSTIRWIMLAAVAMPAVAIALLAAAVARRLHGRGLSGWWGVLPLPFLLIGTVGMSRLLAGFGRENKSFSQGLFGMMFANNAVYLLTILVLITLLVKESDPGPNRFGERPINSSS